MQSFDKYYQANAKQFRELVRVVYKDGYNKGLLEGERQYGNHIFVEEYQSYFAPSEELLRRFAEEVKEEIEEVAEKENTATK